MSTSNTHFPTGGPLVGVNFETTNTSADFPVGTQVVSNGGLWEYVQALSGIAQYNAVCINGSGSAVPSTTTHAVTAKKVGFAQVAIASGSYGWIARSGKNLTVMLAASCAAGAQLYTTATAGTLDDAVVTAAACAGAVCTVAASAGGVTNTTIMAATPAVVISQAAGA